MAPLKFPTLLIVSSASFFLGLLFSLFPYDYPLLWSAGPIAPSHLDLVEANLKLLYHCPKICFQIFHFMIAVGLAGLIAKLYKPSESNMLFDGGSLVLFMVAVVVYISNIVKGMRIVDIGVYGIGLPPVSDGEGKPIGGAGDFSEGDGQVLGREDNLKVLSASNTIVALVLIGVLVLQAGQWYADRQDEKSKKKWAKEDAAAAAEKAERKAKKQVGEAPTSPTVGAKEGKKEGKKTK